ncbi:MAG: hypothetical protein KME06_00050 [Kastovskya adunca ATA6-11-RM4]|jgi:hypothetical protein|nr:hypothetical protein [Kastovskya adunca ATA6-11-RM4]
MQLTLKLPKQLSRFVIATLIGTCLFLLGTGIKDSGIWNGIGSQPAAAQFFQADAWRQVYEKLPDFPLENQYVSSKTGEVNSENTLASRLIRYHVFTKSRTPNYRLDWKLTLADYLGAHEYLVASQYPGNDNLRENPMEGDRAAIESLNRTQRNALVNVLVSIFNPDTTPQTAPSPQSAPPSTTAPASRRNSPLPLPQPGDAQLLRP